MLNRLTKNMAALIFAGAGTAAFAQGYNSFVIEVPYEYALPVSYTEVTLQCAMIDPQRQRLIGQLSKVIPLQNGAARGTFKIGYDVLGSEPGLEPLADFQREAVQSLVSDPNFEINLKCRTTRLTTSNQMLHTVREVDGRPVIYDAAAQKTIAILDGDMDGVRHDLPVTAADDGAGNSETSDAGGFADGLLTFDNSLPSIPNPVGSLGSILEGNGN